MHEDGILWPDEMMQDEVLVNHECKTQMREYRWMVTDEMMM